MAGCQFHRWDCTLPSNGESRLSEVLCRYGTNKLINSGVTALLRSTGLAEEHAVVWEGSAEDRMQVCLLRLQLPDVL